MQQQTTTHTQPTHITPPVKAVKSAVSEKTILSLLSAMAASLPVAMAAPVRKLKKEKMKEMKRKAAVTLSSHRSPVKGAWVMDTQLPPLQKESSPKVRLGLLGAVNPSQGEAAPEITRQKESREKPTAVYKRVAVMMQRVPVQQNEEK